MKIFIVINFGGRKLEVIQMCIFSVMEKLNIGYYEVVEVAYMILYSNTNRF